MELTTTVNDEVRTHVTLSRPAPGERAAYLRVTSRVIEATVHETVERVRA